MYRVRVPSTPHYNKLGKMVKLEVSGDKKLYTLFFQDHAFPKSRYYDYELEEVEIDDLFDLLDNVTVHAPGQWHNDIGPKDWYAVSSDEFGGIFAYFQHENDAFRFRLDYINRKLNP